VLLFLSEIMKLKLCFFIESFVKVVIMFWLFVFDVVSDGP